MFFIIDIKRQLAQQLAQASTLVLIHNHSARLPTPAYNKATIKRLYQETPPSMNKQ
ncbi:hypothetical protein HMPREF9065_01376 [Aggregatibacter sp. oral taxon 458 str. W10330]|nr:hypothetical protein HMPREF9065_01376 [Aggregatibacter sp. oral taxon 458 str. W10330]